MGRKTTIWIFQVTNSKDCVREGINIIMKEKYQEKNWISANNSTKQLYEDQSTKQ